MAASKFTSVKQSDGSWKPATEIESELKTLLIGSSVVNVETDSSGSLSRVRVSTMSGKVFDLNVESDSNWGCPVGWLEVTEVL